MVLKGAVTPVLRTLLRIGSGKTFGTGGQRAYTTVTLAFECIKTGASGERTFYRVKVPKLPDSGRKCPKPTVRRGVNNVLRVT